MESFVTYLNLNKMAKETLFNVWKVWYLRLPCISSCFIVL
jgi:hypothetical protein